MSNKNQPNPPASNEDEILYEITDGEYTDWDEECVDDARKAISRFADLKRKEGAVEELIKMERVVANDLWQYQLKARARVGLELLKRVEELREEIKQIKAMPPKKMEGKP